jgi:hypothetical protein
MLLQLQRTSNRPIDMFKIPVEKSDPTTTHRRHLLESNALGFRRTQRIDFYDLLILEYIFILMDDFKILNRLVSLKYMSHATYLIREENAVRCFKISNSRPTHTHIRWFIVVPNHVDPFLRRGSSVLLEYSCRLSLEPNGSVLAIVANTASVQCCGLCQ